MLFIVFVSVSWVFGFNASIDIAAVLKRLNSSFVGLILVMLIAFLFGVIVSRSRSVVVGRLLISFAYF